MVLVRPHDQLGPALPTCHRRDLTDDGGAEGVLGLVPVAQFGVEALGEQGEAGTERGADAGGDGHPAGPRARRVEPSRVDLHRLGPLERRQIDALVLLGDERSVALVRGAVLAHRGVPLRQRHRVDFVAALRLRRLVAQLVVELLDLLLELLDRGQHRRLALLAHLLLAFGEVRHGLVGEGVDDAHGLIRVGVLHREPDDTRGRVRLHDHAGGEGSRIAVVLELLGDAARDLAGGGEDRYLGERDRADGLVAADRVGEKCVRGLVVGLDRFRFRIGPEEGERRADERARSRSRASDAGALAHSRSVPCVVTPLRGHPSC